MGTRIDQMSQAKSIMDGFYRSIEMDIYRMYQIPTTLDEKGRSIIDRTIVPEDTAEVLLIHLKTIAKKATRVIKIHGLKRYGIDLNKDFTTLKIHILAKPEKGRRSQDDRIEKTVFTHKRNDDYVYDWASKEAKAMESLKQIEFSKDDKKKIRQLRKQARLNHKRNNR